MNALMDKLVRAVASTEDGNAILAVGVGLQLARQELENSPEEFKERFGEAAFDAVSQIME